MQALISMTLVLAAHQFLPFGLWQDQSPSPPLAGFAASTGANAGEITINVDFPASPGASYAEVQLRRLAGATPPASDCASDGTVVKTYMAPTFPDPDAPVDSATAGSSYSYRACIYGINGTLTSSNTVANVLARPACGGTTVAGSCWYYGNTGQSCDTVCTSHGGYSSATQTTGQSQCKSVVDTLTGGNRTVGTGNCSSLYGVPGLGCGWSSIYGYGRCNESTTSNATSGSVRRFCACQY